MHEPTDYRVFDRKKYVLIMVICVGFLSIGGWFGLDHLAEYARQLEKRITDDPQQAEALLTQLFHKISIVNGIVLSSFATLIAWHGWRGWRTASMPPKGSWILEGQRTWSGEPAMRIARFTLAVSAILAALAIVSSFVLWGMADTFMD